MRVGKSESDGRPCNPSPCASALVSLAVALAAVALAALIVPPYFTTKDDPVIQQILAGTLSGHPTAYVPLINVCLAWLLSRLFIVAPGIPWWTFFHLALLACSMAVASQVSVCALRGRGWRIRLWQQAVVLLIACVGLGCALVGRLQFTTTSALAVAVGVYAVLVRSMDSRRFMRGALPGMALLVTGFCMRNNSGMLGLAFLWLVAFLFTVACTVRSVRGGGVQAGRTRQALCALFKEVVRMARPVVAPALCVTLAIGVCLAAHTAAYSTPAWSEFMTQSTTRARFSDYPRPAYEGHEEFYRSIGWSRDLYILARSYYQLDPRINADTTGKVIALGDVGLQRLLAHPKSELKMRLAKLKQPVPMACALAFAVTMAWGLVRLRGWKRLVVTGVAILSLAFMGYLLVENRLLDRAMMAIIFPAIGAVAALSAARQREVAGSKRVIGFGGFGAKAAACVQPAHVVPVAVVLLLAVAAGAAAVSQYGRGSATYAWYQWQERNSEQFYTICRDNPSTLYIFAGMGELDNMDPWRMAWPVNQTSWSGWYYRAPWFGDTLKDAGFMGAPTVNDLLDDNVRFVTDRFTDMNLCRRYFKEALGGDVTLQQECVFGDDVTIWRVVRE